MTASGVEPGEMRFSSLTSASPLRTGIRAKGKYRKR